ncbi:hypothetical protein Q9Q95_13050 [Sphingomonas sp. DG1-23]|uniref:hypothetical protein n=1 Tax=Sphingomonas sp. DG1-23 TaxID=3068316 RepID=UPI00273E6F98|nr:hypothetical protein [Sphingomonas sp. DG1-23]MDP5279855.1 hypothetical protein [Sphingomonas sp. DG1-23]
MTYVSDLLLQIVDAADTRRRVRDECLRLLEPLEPIEQAQLRPLLGYYGGKCMGYPAIWAVSRALGLDTEREAWLIAQVRATLFINITTSIVDDLFDQDESAQVEHLGVLYLLIFEAMLTAQWSPDFAAPARTAFVRAWRNVTQRVEVHDAKAIRVRGQRIGAFFALTAEACAAALDLPAERTRILVDLIESFGNLCGHIDDVLDVATDLARGETANAVLLALGGDQGGDPALMEARLASPGGRQTTERFLADEFEAVARAAEAAGCAELAKSLRGAGTKVFEFLPLDWNAMAPGQMSQPVAI